MGVEIIEGNGQFGVHLGRPIVTNGDDDALSPNYAGEDLLLSLL